MNPLKIYEFSFPKFLQRHIENVFISYYSLPELAKEIEKSVEVDLDLNLIIKE